MFFTKNKEDEIHRAFAAVKKDVLTLDTNQEAMLDELTRIKNKLDVLNTSISNIEFEVNRKMHEVDDKVKEIKQKNRMAAIRDNLNLGVSTTTFLTAVLVFLFLASLGLLGYKIKHPEFISGLNLWVLALGTGLTLLTLIIYVVYMIIERNTQKYINYAFNHKPNLDSINNENKLNEAPEPNSGVRFNSIQDDKEDTDNPPEDRSYY